MFNKIRDLADTKVSMVIVIDNDDMKDIVVDVIKSIGKNRCVYQMYKNKGDFSYLLEIRMPYNRYFAFMRGIQKQGYNLCAESEVDVINTMFKED